MNIYEFYEQLVEFLFGTNETFSSDALADAEISREQLQESQVTLAAFARLNFTLSVSMEPRPDQVSVEGPSGLLSPQDVRFAFDYSSKAAQLKFVVRKEGRYRAVVRLPKVAAVECPTAKCRCDTM